MKWESIDNVLPEDGDEVLVWTEDEGYFIAQRFDAEWYSSETEVVLYNVTHWEYLPTPPRRESL